MPTTFQDGGLIYGSQVVSLVDEDDAAADYVLKNITINYPTKRIVSMNEVGVPNKQAFIDDLVAGTATGQFPSSTAKLPVKYQEFELTKRGDGEDTETFLLVDVADNSVQDGEATFSISFTKKLATE